MTWRLITSRNAHRLLILLTCVFASRSFTSSFLFSRVTRHRSHSFLRETARPTQVFIGNIPLTVTSEQLFDALKEVVPVTSLNLQYDKLTMIHKGFGNVWFNNSENATEAVKLLQGFQMDGVPLRVEPFQPLLEDRTSRLVPNDRSLYVGNLPYTVSREDVLQLCHSVGLTNVLGVRLPSSSSKLFASKGFVHLDFASSDEASEALERLSEGLTLQGRTLRVGRSQLGLDKTTAVTAAAVSGDGSKQPQQQLQQERFVIFVGNVSRSATQTYLEGFLDLTIGPRMYRRATLAVNKDRDSSSSWGRCRGFAHIECWNELGRQANMKRLRGLTLLDRLITVEEAK